MFDEEDDDNGYEDDDDYSEGDIGDDSEPPAEGGLARFDELRAIKEEPNDLRKRELLRYYISRYGNVDDLTKRWLRIKGY